MNRTSRPKTKILCFLLIFSVPAAISGQVQAPNTAPAREDTLQLALLSELQSLDVEATNLTSPLARARAKAEIANALWALDERRAKEILTDAYKLTMPENNETALPQGGAPGKRSPFPSPADQARRDIRNRIMQVAVRDNAFARNLIKLQTENLDKAQAHFDSAMLAKQALDSGDDEALKNHIIDALQADPTQTMAGLIIQELAKKNRASADKLIIDYISMLPRDLTSISEDWRRVYFVLLQLVFPTLLGDQKLQPPGPTVMRAYALYVVESLGSLEQNTPGTLSRIRPIFLTAWLPVQQYAPELIPTFLRLEALSRSNGDTSPIPTMEDTVRSDRDAWEKRLSKALENGIPDVLIIEAAARRGEFSKARKAIDRMDNGEAKSQLIELVDTKEAVALASKGDMPNAERLALRLFDASHIVEVYTALIGDSDKSTAQRISLGYRALSQLRGASNAPPTPLAALPAGLAPTGREADPRLWSLSRLLLTVISLDDDLAQAVLAETILTANRTGVDSTQGRLGFDPNLFKEVMSKRPAQANQAAAALTDPLRRIVAQAVISKCKVDRYDNRQAKANGNDRNNR